MHIHTSIYIYADIHTYIYVYINVYVYIHTYVSCGGVANPYWRHTYVYTYVYIYICVYIYIRIYTYSQLYIKINTHRCCEYRLHNTRHTFIYTHIYPYFREIDKGMWQMDTHIHDKSIHTFSNRAKCATWHTRTCVSCTYVLSHFVNFPLLRLLITLIWDQTRPRPNSNIKVSKILYERIRVCHVHMYYHIPQSFARVHTFIHRKITEHLMREFDYVYTHLHT